MVLKLKLQVEQNTFIRFIENEKQNLSFDQLYDIRALRVLVNSVPECYHH